MQHKIYATSLPVAIQMGVLFISSPFHGPLSLVQVMKNSSTGIVDLKPLFSSAVRSYLPLPAPVILICADRSGSGRNKWRLMSSTLCERRFPYKRCIYRRMEPKQCLIFIAHIYFGGEFAILVIVR